MRKLATVQRIKSLQDIPGKDRIKYASFENIDFRVIVSSDTKVGDVVIYCESDTLLPLLPELEFLKTRCYNKQYNKYRIRCMKLGGLFSEGICLPMSLLPNGQIEGLYQVGLDVTQLLGIEKYDPELLEESELKKAPPKIPKWWHFLLKFSIFRAIYLMLTRKSKETWPVWIKKTDEERFQNMPDIYDKYRHVKMSYSEKIDGQSVTFALNRGRFYVCSRNLVLPEQNGNAYWYTAHKFDVKNKLKQLKKILKSDVYIQAEQAGPGIQGNKLKLPERAMFVFNIRVLKDGRFLTNYEIAQVCARVGLPTVPYFQPIVFDFHFMEELQEYSRGYSVLNPSVVREGLVFRPAEPGFGERNRVNMSSFKVINPDFLLKE